MSLPLDSKEKTSKKIRVLLVDDHLVVRMGMVSLLGFEEDIDVVAQAKDGQQALEQWERHRPDVTVMDVRMPGLDGVEATVALRQAHPKARILLLTTYGDPQDIRRALDAGALGCLLKNASQTQLADAIREVHAGRRFVMREIEARLKEHDSQPQLTERQLEVLRLLAKGLTNSEIAKQIGITLDGVKARTISLYAKLGVSDRAEAVAVALRDHLLRDE